MSKKTGKKAVQHIAVSEKKQEQMLADELIKRTHCKNWTYLNSMLLLLPGVEEPGDTE